MRIRNSIIPNTPVPGIAVLEDVPIRIERLERMFPDVDIAWSTNVVDFCASVDSLALAGKLDLILLDHDLGMNPMDILHGPLKSNFMEDKNGHDGRDACMSMNVYPEVPVFIWSGNEEMAVEMEQILRNRGFLRISKCPVDVYPEKVFEFIKNLLGS